MESVDWFFVITDLQRVGVYPEHAAKQIGVSRNTIQGWKNIQAEPKHYDGEALLKIWRAATGQESPRMRKRFKA